MTVPSATSRTDTEPFSSLTDGLGEFLIRLRHRPDWVQVEQQADGRSTYCFNSSRKYATRFATKDEAAKFAESIPADLVVVPSQLRRIVPISAETRERVRRESRRWLDIQLGMDLR